MPVTMGVPQGSVLGPVLWNVLYDGVLNIELVGDTMTVAYADDLAVISRAKDLDDLIYNTEENLRRIDVWMRYHGLDLAPEKTEAIVLKGPRKRDEVILHLRQKEIKLSKTVSYLGITLDDQGSFGEHVRKTAIKAEDRVARLSRLMPNIGGPRRKKREILYWVVQSIILYGAPIWHNAMRIMSYRRRLEAVQRRSLIRIVSGYRTISTKAIQVVAGVVPIHIMVEERKKLYDMENGHTREAKMTARKESVETWQKEWEENVETGQWTKTLIRNIQEWVQCEHRETDYYMTQVLTGHGCFRSYTARIGKSPDDRCEYCGEVDSPRHTLFSCQRWQRVREETNLALGAVLTEENMVDMMISTKGAWQCVHSMVRKVMQTKEKDERERQIRDNGSDSDNESYNED